jgi:predicted methyltransferase
MIRTFFIALSLVAPLWVSHAGAADLSPTLEKLKTAMAMDHRSEKNTVRDKNRDPLKAMDFCGLRDDMTVIEFGPGGGWYTELLGPVLQEKGALYISYKESWMARLDELLDRDFMSAVKKHPIDIGWVSAEDRFDVGDIRFDVENADLALNIREYHNFNEEGAMKLNTALYAALKPGGHYCIIDHTRRHMESTNSENRRRADPVQVIKEVQAAGFQFVDWSDQFLKPDDELRYEVGRKTVTGNTDRFSLLFVKP